MQGIQRHSLPHRGQTPMSRPAWPSTSRFKSAPGYFRALRVLAGLLMRQRPYEGYESTIRSTFALDVDRALDEDRHAGAIPLLEFRQPLRADHSSEAKRGPPSGPAY